MSGNGIIGGGVGGGIFFNETINPFNPAPTFDILRVVNIIGFLNNPRPELTTYNGAILDRPASSIFVSGGELADNGGDVKTVKLLDATSNPAIDGSGADALPADAIGRPAQDFPGRGGDDGLPGVRDIGAFELPLLTGGPPDRPDDPDDPTDPEDPPAPTGPTDDSDRLIGGADSDTIRAASGDDAIRGSGGGDVLRGNGGGDEILGGGGGDIIRGGGGADTIKGGGGADRLFGNGGDDVLQGLGGNDTLTGGGGRDVFQFRASDRADEIRDFRQGQDMIEILSGAQRFDQLSFEQDGRDVLVSFGAAGQVRVVSDNAAAFDETDFIF